MKRQYSLEYLSKTEELSQQGPNTLPQVRKITEMAKDKILVINLSGRGDKDVYQIARYRGVNINE